MKAIDLFPYWNDNRALLVGVIGGLPDEELEVRPAPGLRSLGEVLRHVIATEEYWWYGGINGAPYDRWRPQDKRFSADEWNNLTNEEKEAARARRFPTVAAIVDGLHAAHAPVESFLRELDAADLCEKRRATWGDDNTLRWILWHLVEHDQHHRAQIFTRLRMRGHAPPQIWPRPSVMARTPAHNWHPGDVAITDVVPFWKQVHASLRRATAALTDQDLAFAHMPGRPTIHDLVLHIVIWEDFLIRQNLGRQVGKASGKIQGWFWRSDVSQMAANVGSYFPTVAALLEGMDEVHAATRTAVAGLSVTDLARTVETPRGPQSVHHLLWYAREHTIHHRAQLFFRMRMAGRTPPEI
jgi:uncharacterized damage-inducible protein DinB